MASPAQLIFHRYRLCACITSRFPPYLSSLFPSFPMPLRARADAAPSTQLRYSADDRSRTDTVVLLHGGSHLLAPGQVRTRQLEPPCESSFSYRSDRSAFQRPGKSAITRYFIIATREARTRPRRGGVTTCLLVILQDIEESPNVVLTAVLQALKDGSFSASGAAPCFLSLPPC